jgi:hypothetical protein
MIARGRRTNIYKCNDDRKIALCEGVAAHSVLLQHHFILANLCIGWRWDLYLMNLWHNLTGECEIDGNETRE